MSVLKKVAIDDKYEADESVVFISGRQALVRLPILQHQSDARRGLRTAGLVTGYRGSPLGGYDSELWSQRKRLEAADIRFLPGLNEDLAATAVWGSQQIKAFPGQRYDGVFAIWYGKGPGVHRSGDPFHHANMQGVDANGGVLLLFGDDHPGKSSTVAHQSDLVLAAYETPVLYPSSVAEVMEYGLAGFALSRFSGLVTSMKLVNETAEMTATVDMSRLPQSFVLPDLAMPPGGVHARREFLAVRAQDHRLVHDKLPRAHAFARANALDRIVFGSQTPRLAIVTAGKSYPDVRSALDQLGIDGATAADLGIGLFKVAMIYPLEPDAIRAATAGASDILFVEERRPHLEPQAAAILFDRGGSQRIWGKNDPEGRPFLPADGPMEVEAIVRAITAWLKAAGATLPASVEAAITRIEQRRALRSAPSAVFGRRPGFCAGCPHNTSTRVPEGSTAMTGIGCHGMAAFLPDRNAMPPTQMGGEGAQWIGIAPFVDTPHVFQNLGDGTYNHSGSLAVRAAVQAGVNITYKILYNDAVAMTGGQPVEGALTVERIARQMLAEDVKAVVVVAEDPSRFSRDEPLPGKVELRHRDDLDEVQKRLRDIPGTTVIIYDQTCAAEKRRRRKRGTFAAASSAAFINPLVCEGCGDCSVQSNCVAIRPLDTEFGLKRTIDQSACNSDLSCLKGFCPSFVTISGGKLRRKAHDYRQFVDMVLPDPQIPALGGLHSMLVSGVGGTGVVTIGAVLGMAAHLEGHLASVYDMTGLSQKGGAVLSHLRLVREGTVVPARIGAGEADLLLACDALAGASPDAAVALAADRTQIVANADVEATADFQLDPARRTDADHVLAELARLRGGPVQSIPASSTAAKLLGDTIGANMMMVGFAWQLGRIPLRREAIEAAIRLNGVAIDFNLAAFALGRLGAQDRARFDSLLAVEPVADPQTMPIDELVASRAAELEAYQDRAYADRYRAVMAALRSVDAASGDDRLSRAAAQNAFRMMAYKDEYEVARLYADGRFEKVLADTFGDSGKRKFLLARPGLTGTDPRTGRPRKVALPSATMLLFKVLMRMKRLRGTALDPFGWNAERKIERRLRDEYLELLADLAMRTTTRRYEAAVALAEAAGTVRGYGPVKLASIAPYEQQLAGLRAGFDAIQDDRS